MLPCPADFFDSVGGRSAWVRRWSAFGQRLERLLDAVRDGGAGGYGLESECGFLVGVAQRQQCVEDVGLGIVDGMGAAGRAKFGPELALQFKQQALGRFLPDAG